MNYKNLFIGLLIIFVVWGVVTVLALDDAKERVEETQTERPSKIEVMKKNYMAGCEPEANYNYCDCTWDYLTDTHTESELVDLFQYHYETGKFTPEMEEAVYKCEHYIQLQSS